MNASTFIDTIHGFSAMEFFSRICRTLRRQQVCRLIVVNGHYVVQSAEVEVNGKFIGSTDENGYSPPFPVRHNQRLSVRIHINGRAHHKDFDCVETDCAKTVIEFQVRNHSNHRNKNL
jgi:hypothetical protein